MPSMSNGDTPTYRVSLLSIFSTFAKIGSFTLGGGYAMIPLLQDEMVRRGWIPEKELPDIIALAQSAPGLLAMNVAVFAGYKIRGIKGSIAASLGTVVPSFVIILIVAMLLANFRDYPIIIRIFKGIRPVVISLIIVPAINMERRGNGRWWTWAISIITLIAVAFMNVSPIYVLLVIIVLATAISVYKEKRGGGA